MGDVEEQQDVWAELGHGFVHEAVVVAEETALAPAEKAHHRHLRALEDKVLEHSLRIVADAMHFDEVDDNAAEELERLAAVAEAMRRGEPPSPATAVAPQQVIPAHWIAELGEEGAKRRMRMARAAWKPIKDSAVGFKIATQVFTGIVKARSVEKGKPVELNIGVVQLSAPLPQFERRKVLSK